MPHHLGHPLWEEPSTPVRKFSAMARIFALLVRDFVPIKEICLLQGNNGFVRPRIAHHLWDWYPGEESMSPSRITDLFQCIYLALVLRDRPQGPREGWDHPSPGHCESSCTSPTKDWLLYFIKESGLSLCGSPVDPPHSPYGHQCHMACSGDATR